MLAEVAIRRHPWAALVGLWQDDFTSRLARPRGPSKDGRVRLMAAFVLPFEKHVVDLVDRVKQLRKLAASDAKFEPELQRLEEKAGRLARELFADLTPMQ